MKKLYLALTLILALCLLCACGSDEPDVPDVPEVTVSTIGAAVEGAFSNTDLSDIPDAYVENMLKLDSAAYSERYAKISSVGTNIDEFGIFKANEGESVSALKDALNDYLAYRMEIWMDEYLSEEKPKLENAQVLTEGDYAMYLICDSATFDAAKAQFESCFAPAE